MHNSRLLFGCGFFARRGLRFGQRSTFTKIISLQHIIASPVEKSAICGYIGAKTGGTTQGAA